MLKSEFAFLVYHKPMSLMVRTSLNDETVRESFRSANFQYLGATRSFKKRSRGHTHCLHVENFKETNQWLSMIIGD